MEYYSGKRIVNIKPTPCCAPDTASAPHTHQHTDHVLELRIEGMDCPTEEALIRDKLGKMEGIEALDFNLMQRKLTIRHKLDSDAPVQAALESIGMAGVPIASESAVATPSGASTLVLRIDKMDCPTEEALIRDKLTDLVGVIKMDFNLIQRKLTVAHTLHDSSTIEAALQSIGMEGVRMDATQPVGAAVPPPAVSNRQWFQTAIGILAATGAEVVAWKTGQDASVTVAILAITAILASGLGTYKKGWIALKNFNLNINALMAIAVTGAVAIGQWPEAAMVMVLFSIAEMIEALSLDRARNAIRSLMSMAPDKAEVKQSDGTWEEKEASAVAIDDTVRVQPGQRIALDGKLTAGQSAVNQAPITGESIPVSKEVGDPVFAGTINETGSFEYRVTAVQANSTLSRIIKAIEDAQGSKAPTQRFVDQFSKIYTPTVFLIALGVALIPPLAMGLPWMFWIYKALVLLVIACPCALVISTPVTVVSGLAAAAKAGILIKGGAYLEEGRKLNVLALDKTGTLTKGKPEVTKITALSGEAGRAIEIAAALAGRSNHPVSSAVTRYWEAEQSKAGTKAAPLEVTEFSALTGRGTKGRIDGQWYYLGNHRLIEELKICSPATEAILEPEERAGNTAVLVATETEPLAVISVADTVRESSRQAVAELQKMGIRTIMLTGDNAHTAAAIGKKVGIDDARGDLLPEDKLAFVESEIANKKSVGMVGDGINDAPALARSNIGFAMGAAGTDTALETADVALMDDDLRKIPQFVRLSRRASGILKQNIGVALGIKAVFFVLAFAGQADLWMAVFADMGASLIVVFNGLRMLKAPRNGNAA